MRDLVARGAPLAIRLLIALLVILALLGFVAPAPPQHRAVVGVVDLSDSLRASRAAEEQVVRTLISSKKADDLLGVVTFARNATVEFYPVQRPYFNGFQTRPDPSGTDLAAGLQLAAGILPDGYAGELLVVSDGRENLDDAATVAAAIRSRGIRVDVAPLRASVEPDALITAIDVPSQVRTDQSVSAAVRVKATSSESGTLSVSVDDGPPSLRQVTLDQSLSTQVFNLPPLREGWHRITARLSVQPDAFAENNSYQAVVHVLGKPRVLVLHGPTGDARNIDQALTAAGMSVDDLDASQAPTDTTALAAYDSTVIADAPAQAFPNGSLAALAATVHDLGHGLVAIGGPSSYGPGNWQNTSLEQALPVRMEARQARERPKIAVALLIESVEDVQGDEAVLAATEAVTQNLKPDDQVTIVDADNGVLLPLTPASNKTAIRSALQNAQLGDPQSYATGLKAAERALSGSDARVKHVVLVGDGDADPFDRTVVNPVLDEMRGMSITTSSVIVDNDQDPAERAYMAGIASRGGGRYALATDWQHMPQVFFDETVDVARPWIEQSSFIPKTAGLGDLLRGISTPLPQLDGYVVTTAKQAAEVYLQSQKDEPILAAWRYGLGRTVAWTSDARGLWTAHLLSSPDAAPLFARMVAYTLAQGESGAHLEASLVDQGLSVRLDSPAGTGKPELHVVDPSLGRQMVDMSSNGTGSWSADLKASVAGTYLLHASVPQKHGGVAQADLAVAVPYSPEYLEQGIDQPLLSRLGSRLSSPVAAWQVPIQRAALPTNLFWWLLLLAAILWPIDIALRRWRSG